MALRNRILLLVTGLVMGLSVLLLFTLNTVVDRAIEHLVQADTAATQQLLRQLVEERSRGVQQACQILASQPALRSLLQREGNDPDEATFAEYARGDALTFLGASAVAIADMSGRVRGYSDADLATLGTLPLLHQVLSGTVCNDMVLYHDAPAILVAVPVQRGEYVQGALIAVFLLDNAALAPLGKAVGADVLLTRRSRVYAATRPLREPFFPLTGGVERRRIGGTEYALTSVPLHKGSPWSIVVLTRPEALHEGNRLRWLFLGFSALFLMLALSAGMVLARSLTHPLMTLTEAARALRRGEWPTLPPAQRPDEIGVLQDVFSEMVVAVRNSQDRLKEENLATIQALAAAVDAKDPYTRGHSRRVAHYAALLTTHLGLSEDHIERIYTAGTLHDIGKIGVPDAVLNKPDRLTREERNLMEEHPVLGEGILRRAPQLAPILPAVRHHHERWDGAGYPDRLRAEAIPLEARILALADTFDAITSDRPYRRGRSFRVALDELERVSGSQFDPALVPAFVAVILERMAAGELTERCESEAA